MVYIGLHFHETVAISLSSYKRNLRTKCLPQKKSSMQVHSTCLALAALLMCMTVERRSRKHCGCVCQDLVPVFKEGQSTSER